MIHILFLLDMSILIRNLTEFSEAISRNNLDTGARAVACRRQVCCKGHLHVDRRFLPHVSFLVAHLDVAGDAESSPWPLSIVEIVREEAALEYHCHALPGLNNEIGRWRIVLVPVRFPSFVLLILLLDVVLERDNTSLDYLIKMI